MSEMWNRPPTILPNYGRLKKRKLKTNVTRVLLHDNAQEQQFLTARLGSLGREQQRSAHSWDLTRFAFIQRVNRRRKRALSSHTTTAAPQPLLSELPPLFHQPSTKPGASVTTSLPNAPTDGRGLQRTVTWADNSRTNRKHPSGHVIGEEDSDNEANDVSDDDVDNEVDQDNDEGTDEARDRLPDINHHRRIKTVSTVPRRKSSFTTYDLTLRRSMTDVAANNSSKKDRASKLGGEGVSGILGGIKDIRYVRLSDSLSTVDARCDTALQLSPSGYQLMKAGYGRPLCDLDDFKTVLASFS